MLKNVMKSGWVMPLMGLGLLAIVVKLALAIPSFTPGNQPTGYVAQDEVTSYNLRSGTETLYRVEYEKEFYSGNLYSYPVDANGNVDTASEWWGGGANSHIDAQNFDTGRKIATMKDDGTGIPFRFTSLSGTQQGYLTSSTILDFLRGDRSQEIPNTGKTLRQRKSALGDIVHSRPYYVSDASNPTIFVGANDGMLHAINAATSGGEERWAYVPSMLLSKMKNLSISPYVRDLFVDGQINIASISSSGSKRILVGGLGGGGKGLYALDITGSSGLTASSETALASKVLWEIVPSKVNYVATSDYVNLGYTYGTPTVAKVAGADRVIVGNGYNDNTSGDYQAYLFVINPYTGQRTAAIKAGTSGTASSPNGLSTPVAVDSNGDGSVELVYAGDLNGTMWKFDLTAGSATALFTTSPVESITSTPGILMHPSGGYMVTFGTGRMLTATDATDVTTAYHAYGVWDGAAGTNMVTQTLTERSYTNSVTGVISRVRTVTANQANWATDKGWRVALPAGERVVGDGSFVENGRFYFTAFNPTLSMTVPNTTTVIYGQNWLMELDALTGGSKNHPFLDMNGDVKLDDADRVKYTAADTLPSTTPPTSVGDPILTTNGIPVGKFLSVGVLSQPILVQLSSLNDTLFNQNPDVTIPPATLAETGVTGGHFDADIFYGTAGGGASASATITVSSTGNSRAATLGGITVDGVSIVPALSTSNITNGTSTSTNATTIKNQVTGGFSATVSGNVVTVSAPAGAAYNGKTLAFLAGTSNSGTPAVTGVRPTGLISFAGTATSSSNDAWIDDDLSNSSSIRVGGSSAYSNTITLGKSKSPTQAASIVVGAIGTGGSNFRAYIGGNSITPTCASQSSAVVCLVDMTTYGNGNALTMGTKSNFGSLTVSMTATAGGVSPVAAAGGWDNLSPYLAGTTFSGGSDGTVGDTCTNCNTKSHTHQYDDKFDVTGVDMLNPSEANLRLSKAIPSTSTAFKVLAMNQYLSPAVKLHIGNPSYLFNVDAGYISLKNYATSTILDLATLATYTRANIGSLVINMPLDALTSKDWWGTGDIRSGLHPAGNYLCPISSATSSNDGNMFRPVIPPANGVTGPGTAGWSGSTTPSTAIGARHNGALTIQVISASTPNTAIEQNVAGRPEYGWRVMSRYYATYVLAEYVFFWHTPHPVTHAQNTGPCYQDAGWTKSPEKDPTYSALSTKASGSTDPKIGDLSAGGGGAVLTTTTTVVGNVTTTVFTYAGGATASIVRTTNVDNSVTIVTTDASGNVTTQIVAVTSGSVKSGGDELGLQARTGRISWRELVSP